MDVGEKLLAFNVALKESFDAKSYELRIHDNCKNSAASNMCSLDSADGCRRAHRMPKRYTF